MPDTLTPQERALIDAALAAGRVTVVPRGVSGLPLPVMDPASGHLRYAQPQGWVAARDARLMRRAHVPVDRETADEIVALRLHAVRPRDIAARLKIEARIVHMVCRAARKSGVVFPEAGIGRPASDARARQARVAALFSAGQSYSEIAEAMGLTRGQVAGLLARGRANGEAGPAVGDRDAA